MCVEADVVILMMNLLFIYYAGLSVIKLLFIYYCRYVGTNVKSYTFLHLCCVHVDVTKLVIILVLQFVC